MDKLVITKQTVQTESRTIVRISNKSNAMLEDISRRTGRSKASIVDMLIEVAYDSVEIGSDKE